MTEILTDNAIGQRHRRIMNRTILDVAAAREELTATQDRVTILEGAGDSTPPTAADLGFGWADYADSTYTAGAPFSVPPDVNTILPNDGIGGVKTYEPSNFTMYGGGGKSKDSKALH